MSYNSLFGNPTHPRTNIHNDPVKANLGTKLNNVRDRRHTQKEIPIFDIGNTITYQPVSTYGASLLDTTSLADLRATILENTNEEAIRLLADGNNEINFYTGGVGASNLKLQILDSSIDVKNSATLNTANIVVGTNNHIKQKIEDSGARVLVESVAKQQYCLYAYEANNSGFLVQARRVGTDDILEINNYRNSDNTYQPISINRSITSSSYVVCGDDVNPTTITTADFVSNGQSVFCNAADVLLDVNSTNIQPYKNIIPSGSLDIGATATRFNNIYNNISTITDEIRLNTFAPVGSDYRQKGIFFRDGFNGTSNGDNMSIRSIERNDAGTLVGDRLMLSSYGGLSVNYFTNNAGNDGSTGRIALFHDAITFHKSLTFDVGESITADRLQSTGTTTDLFLGTNSISKVVLKGGVLGTVEFLAPAITPAVNNTNTVGNATKRWAEVFATNGTINTSDRNAKKDIQPITGALQFVRKLKPVQYKWKENSHGRTHTGFIAQDVLEANPLGLGDKWSGYIDTGNGLGLRYTEFVSVNTQAIKELDEKLKIMAIRLNNTDCGEGVKVDLNYHTDSSEVIERLEILENRELTSIVEEYDDSELKEEMKQLKIDMLDLKIENKKQEDCISQLISDNMNLTEKLNMIMERFDKFVEDKPNVKLQVVDDSDILLSETGDNDHMELVEQRLHTLETKLTKVENKQKKITTIVNKLNKA